MDVDEEAQADAGLAASRTNTVSVAVQTAGGNPIHIVHPADEAAPSGAGFEGTLIDGFTVPHVRNSAGVVRQVDS
jgi:hypothetical protein